MFPLTLLDADVKSTAERKVFDDLRDQLPDEWDAFHSASLIFRDAASGAQDGESDFVLAHPERGIISLEVKGGGIECRHGEWYRLNGKTRERIADPFGQALDHRYDLGRKLKDVHGWERHDLLLVHALAFPDISVHKLVLASDAPPQLIIDREACKDIAAAIDRVLAYHAGAREQRTTLGPSGMERLRNTLAPDVRIAVPLATTFDEEERQLITLTAAQAVVLRRLSRDKRMVVSGCAGSGKTMLAIERGKELAAKGRNVLFVCFNSALARHLAAEKIDNLEVRTFHALCTYWAKTTGVDLPVRQDPQPPEYWRTELPNAFVAAIAEDGAPYDDILVDEAQDLHGDWLAALTWALRDEREGSIWLFMDDNQRVYDVTLEVPDEYRPFDLTVNCRNTQAIHREVMKLYDGSVEPEVIGPAGRPIEFIQTDDQPAVVAGVVKRLTQDWDVPKRDIVVLSSHGRERSAVYASGGYSDKRGRGVYFSSIRGFKGLESPVVVLSELEDLDQATQAKQLYVGVSRAVNHCVIVAPG
jgi:hypothetical protein